MAVNYEAHQPYGQDKKQTGQDYKSSLSALESAWIHVESTKENLDNVDRKIQHAKNFLFEGTNERMQRKYSKKRVKMDLHPEIRYKDPNDVDDTDSMISQKVFKPRRAQLYPNTTVQFNRNGYEPNFQYDSDQMSDDIFRTPVVPKLSPSIMGKSLSSSLKDSGALERLRQKIKQQKENLSLSEQQELFPRKVNHTELDPVILTTVPTNEPMKRKLASTANAPSYKGFNLPEAREHVAQSKQLADIQSKKLLSHQERKERAANVQLKTFNDSRLSKEGQSKNLKTAQKKSPGKMQRKTAQRKPMPSITTTSWRAGKEAIKQALTSLKNSKEPKQKTEIEKNAEKPEIVLMSDDESKTEDDTADPYSPKFVSQSTRTEGDTGTSKAISKSSTTDHDQGSSPTDKDNEDDLKTFTNNLSMHEDLPDDAKSMLAELQMDSSDKSDEEVAKEKDVQLQPVSRIKHSGIKSSVKRKATSMDRRNDAEKYNKPKIRHYDQEAVQNFMAKQLAERKKKRLQEKKRQQQLKIEQEKKLKELYNKQKNSLKSSRMPNQKGLMGSTFTKQQNISKIKNEQGKFVQKDVSGDAIYPENSQEADQHNEYPAERPSPLASARTFSVLDESSPDKPIVDEDVFGDDNQMEDELRDSLEIDQSANDLLGIRSVTVKKHDKDVQPSSASSPSVVLKDAEPVKNVEDEVRELIEKYKSRMKTIEKSANIAEADSPGRRSKAERIAAISATASSLRERIAAEANRLANLRLLPERERPAPNQTRISEGFKGTLPGIKNVDMQAELNEDLREKEEAATIIQAAYRGHSVRQGLNWKLPSGQTFGASLRKAKEQSKMASSKAPMRGSSRASSKSSYSSLFESGSEASLFSEETESTASLISEARKANEIDIQPFEFSRPKFTSLQSEKLTKNRTAFTKDRKKEDDVLADIFQHPKQNGGDRYSVINILTRRLKQAEKIAPTGKKPNSQSLAVEENIVDAVKSSHRQDDLYEQDFEDAECDSSSSTIKTDVLDEEDLSPSTLKDDNRTVNSSIHASQTNKSSTTRLMKSAEEDPDETLTLPQEELRENETSVMIKSYVSGDNSADDSTTMFSHPKSPESLTDGSVDLNKQPVMMSTMRLKPDTHPSSIGQQDTSEHQLRVSSSAVGNMFSPSALERRLRAEVNQLEAMDDALRQVADIEHVRGVSSAQQETVSLAQILKARQLGHQQELEKMSELAKQQVLIRNRDLQMMQGAAAKSAEDASRAIAKVQDEASNALLEARQRYEKAQEDAAKREEQAAARVDKAQKLASEAVLETANRYSSNIETLATSAASAAASSAVQTALQFHRERLEQLRKEALSKVSKSHTQSSSVSGSSSGDSTLTKSGASVDRSPSPVKSYADDDFEDVSPDRGSTVDESSRTNRDNSSSSINDTPKSTEMNRKTIESSKANSISEDLDQINASPSASSRTTDIEVKSDAHSTPISKKSGDRDTIEATPKQSDVEQKSFRFEDHLGSSLTEDEIDDGFRMVLPVVSHRRKSLEKDRRARYEKLPSDNGTSSDDSKLTPRKIAKPGNQSVFAGEDTFSQFTAEMVRQYLQEEEIRSRHQTALLKLREKALIEKSKAEMAWLELQKSTLKNKGADDQMPPLKKKQRGIWMKLQSEQSEIKRLKQAYRQASQERRFMLYQQKEIQRLKEDTRKIWNKMQQEKGTKGGGEHTPENVDRSISEASSIASVDHSSAIMVSGYRDKISPHTSSVASSNKSRTVQNSSAKTKSPHRGNLSSGSSGEIPEDILSEHQVSPESRDQSSFPSYSRSTRKTEGASSSKSQQTSIMTQEAQPTIKSEEISRNRSKNAKSPRTDAKQSTEDLTISERTESSMINDLNRLKKKASEKYFLKREQHLNARRSQFESVLQKQKDMADWQKRIEGEEMRLKADIRRALDRTKHRITQPSLSSFKTLSEEHSRSKQKNEDNSTISIQSAKASKERLSESDTSITEDLKTASVEIESEIPEESVVLISNDLSKRSDSSIGEEYTGDTFESTATKSPNTGLSERLENQIKSSIRSLSIKKYSKESDESRSEEDTSIADATSDASDIEKRIHQLEDELRRRRKDLDLIRRKRNKDNLRNKEQRLKQELQAVENLISDENKENAPHDRYPNDTGTFIKGSVSPKIRSPKILQQTNTNEQSCIKTLKKKSPQSKETTEILEEQKPEVDSQSEIGKYPKQARSVVDKGLANDTTQIEGKKQSSPESGVKCVSEEVAALRRHSKVDTATEQTTSIKSYGTGDFEDESTKISEEASLREEISARSDLSRKTEDRKASSKSIISELDLKNDGADSEVVGSHLLHDSDTASMVPSAVSYRSDSSSVNTMSRAKDSEKLEEKKEVEIDERSDSRLASVRSMLADILSDKSVSEEINSNVDQNSNDHHSRPRSVSSEQRDDSVDDIYNDDFFESSSSTLVKSREFVDEHRTDNAKLSAKDSTVIEDILSTKDSSSRSQSITTASRSELKANEIDFSASASALSRYDTFHLNDRILVDNELSGTIRFIGKTSFSPVVVAGIELDHKQGNTDGSFRGKRYFTCAPDFGMFSPFKNISLDAKTRQNLQNAKNSTDTSIEEVDEIISEHLDDQDDIDHDGSHLLSRSISSQSHPIKAEDNSLHKGTHDKQVKNAEDDIVKSTTAPEISYANDFDDGLISAEQPSRSQIHSASDASKHSTGSKQISKPYIDDFESADIAPPALPASLTPASLTGSEVDSSEADLLPGPPRVDIDQLADSLTRSLLKKLLAESFQVSELCIKTQDRVPCLLDEAKKDGFGESSTIDVASRKELTNTFDALQVTDKSKEMVSSSGRNENRDKTTISALQHNLDKSLSSRKVDVQVSGKVEANEIEHDLTDEEISEILENISEKSDDTIKRMLTNVRGLDREVLEIDEAYVTPTASSESISAALSKEVTVKPTSEKENGSFKDQHTSILHVQNTNKFSEDDSELLKIPKSIVTDQLRTNADNEIRSVTKTLFSNAFSYMEQVMQKKAMKLSLTNQSRNATPNVELPTGRLSSAPHSSPLNVNVIVKDKDGIVVSPPDLQSPPAPALFDDAEGQLTKPPPAFDSNLLAEKLSELKRMDQEIDDLLGEDSDDNDDEPFGVTEGQNILQLPDDETDLIPPVRDFDFGEPVLHVPHSVTDVNKLVAESANIVISKMVHGEEYDDISVDETFLKSDVENIENELENVSRVWYRQMIFDVTRDLFREAKEFKSIQTVAKQPWARPTRRIFAKFIRQIHHLTGQELVNCLQKHVCVCLGLEEGRPSLDVLKKKLPLNTAKKDYIDALLVEELREEEPQWVNYDEDELRVKDQLTDGIIEGLINETVVLISEIQSRRTFKTNL